MVWIGVLGPLQVRYEGRELPLRDGRQRSVLAALAVNANRTVMLDELAETVWDGEPPPSADATLRNYVSRLRHALGPGTADRLETRRSGYLMRLAAEELDLTCFDALYRAGAAAARDGDWPTASRTLTRALALWRGTPLADVPSRSLQEEHGQRLAQVRLQAVEQRIEAELGLGLHGRLAPELYELVRRHPLHERFHAQLMVALARSGRRAEALAVFRAARRLLVQELGVEPGSELRAVHQQLLSGDPVPLPSPSASAPPPSAAPDSAPPPAQLPAEQPDFTGRSELVSELAAELGGDASGGNASVSGAGGAGKTALAVHVGHLLRERFPDGQLYVDLGGSGSRPADPAEVLGRLLRGLGLPPEAVPAAPEERAARYRSRLAGRRVLVLLDDARDAAQVRPLLPGAGRSRALVTSRVRLFALDGTRPVVLGGLDADEAGALFRRIVGHRRVDAEPSATEQVLTACEGLPLAIRIAADRLAARPGWSVRALADRLADESRVLDELVVGDLAVRAGFDADYARLSPSVDAPMIDASVIGAPMIDAPMIGASAGSGGGVDPARCFRLLGSVPGPHFGVPAAAALLGVPAEQAESALEALVDANLLGGAGPGRYRLTGLTLAYSLDRAEAEEPAEGRRQAVRRLLAWFLRTAAAASAQLPADHWSAPADLPDPVGAVPVAVPVFKGRDEAAAWLETEAAGLVAGVHLAARLGHHDIAWRLPLALYGFLAPRGGHAQATALCELAHESARRSDDPQAEAHVLTRLAAAYLQAGHHHQALFHGRQALGRCQALGDRSLRADALLVCGAAHQGLGHLAEAVRDFTEVAALYRAAGQPGRECDALLALGRAHREGDQAPEAAAAFNRCLTVAQRNGEADAEHEAFGELGPAHGLLAGPGCAAVPRPRGAGAGAGAPSAG